MSLFTTGLAEMGSPLKRHRSESFPRSASPDALAAAPAKSVGGGAAPDSRTASSQNNGPSEARDPASDGDECALMHEPRAPAAPEAPGKDAAAAAAALPDMTVNSTAVRVLSRRAAPPRPTTRGAVTTLHAIAQLRALVASANAPAAPSAAAGPADPLAVAPGETFIVLLHRGEEARRALVTAHTEALSRARVFTLDLAALPPHEYDVADAHATDDGGAAAAAGQRSPDAPDGAQAGEDDEEEEGELSLFGAPAPLPTPPPLTAAPDAPRSARGQPRTSLSGLLQRGAEEVLGRVGEILRVDAILNPLAPPESPDAPEGTAAAAAPKEPLLLPAMVVWRAAGAPAAEYPPLPPAAPSQGPPPPSQLPPFSESMARGGGPLVVKQVHDVTAVHSLSLCVPTYTARHLLRTLCDAAAAAGSPAGHKALLYIGASWCPPCMRVVAELPAMLAEDLPPAIGITLKGDVDTGRPIYDLFRVTLIPTFVVLDCEALQRHRALLEAPPGPGTAAALERCLRDAELGRLQNSNRTTIRMFLEKQCTTLSFDEDF